MCRNRTLRLVKDLSGKVMPWLDIRVYHSTMTTVGCFARIDRITDHHERENKSLNVSSDLEDAIDSRSNLNT